MKVKFSTKYWAKVKRIERLPQFMEEMIRALRKKDAYTMIREFHRGIKMDSFGLTRLKEGTIKRKRALGYQYPEVPLYGKGDEERERSYINLLRVQKLKNGYKVFPSKMKHHTADMRLLDLFRVHEFGTTIHRGTTLIRIPSRPAFFLAFQRALGKLKKEENTKMVKNAIVSLVREGQLTHNMTVQLRALKRLELIEENS